MAGILILHRPEDGAKFAAGLAARLGGRFPEHQFLLDPAAHDFPFRHVPTARNSVRFYAAVLLVVGGRFFARPWPGTATTPMEVALEAAIATNRPLIVVQAPGGRVPAPEDRLPEALGALANGLIQRAAFDPGREFAAMDLLAGWLAQIFAGHDGRFRPLQAPPPAAPVPAPAARPGSLLGGLLGKVKQSLGGLFGGTARRPPEDSFPRTATRGSATPGQDHWRHTEPPASASAGAADTAPTQEEIDALSEAYRRRPPGAAGAPPPPATPAPTNRHAGAALGGGLPPATRAPTDLPADRTVIRAPGPAKPAATPASARLPEDFDPFAQPTSDEPAPPFDPRAPRKRETAPAPVPLPADADPFETTPPGVPAPGTATPPPARPAPPAPAPAAREAPPPPARLGDDFDPFAEPAKPSRGGSTGAPPSGRSIDDLFGLDPLSPRAKGPPQPGSQTSDPLAAFGAARPPDPVLLGASAPQAVAPGEEFTARLVAYLPEQQAAVSAELARLSPRSTPHLGIKSCQWQRGISVTVALGARGLQVSPAAQTFVWRGARELVEFDVAVPESAAPGTLVLKFDVSIDAIVVARLRLELAIAATAQAGERAAAQAQTAAARSAFASYSSQDRERVLDRVAAVRISAGLDVFLDCLSLHPGEPWKPRLEREIAARDLFLLFWSLDAATSPWVTWEWQTALGRKGKEAMQIHPLQSGVTPPPELKDLHFGDVFMLVREAGRVP